MKIHLTSCETGPDSWRHEEGLLRRAWELSARTHSLTDDTCEAELIIIGNVREENFSESLRRNRLISKYPEKCFVVSNCDNPLPLLRGVYANMDRRLPSMGRMRSGSYFLYHPDLKNPFVENYVGQASERPKKFLLTFTGRNCHRARNSIFTHPFNRPDILIRDTSNFNAFTHESDLRMSGYREYVEILESSKFVLCPRGIGVSSIRLFESMRIGVAPIILSDDYILPKGPDWKSFALFVPEKEVARVEEIAEKHEDHYREMGLAAAAAYRQFFSAPAYFDYVVSQCLDIQKTQRIPESVFWSSREAVVFGLKVKRRLRRNPS